MSSTSFKVQNANRRISYVMYTASILMEALFIYSVYAEWKTDRHVSWKNVVMILMFVAIFFSIDSPTIIVDGMQITVVKYLIFRRQFNMTQIGFYETERYGSFDKYTYYDKNRKKLFSVSSAFSGAERLEECCREYVSTYSEKQKYTLGSVMDMKAEIHKKYMEEAMSGSKADLSEINTRLDEKFGFHKTRKEIIHCCVDDQEYCFPYETNRVFRIEEAEIVFAVVENRGKRCVFINRDFDVYQNDSPAYRTYYAGLMKEPFHFIFRFEEEFHIHSEKGEFIRMWTEPKQ